MGQLTLVAVFLVGMVIAYIVFYLLNKSKNTPESGVDENLLSEYNESITALKVNEEKINTLTAQNKELAEKLNSKEDVITQLQKSVAALDTQFKNSESKIDELINELTKERENNATQSKEINKHKEKIAEFTANNKSISESLLEKNEANKEQAKQVKELNKELTEQTSQISKLTAKNTFLDEKLKTQKKEIEDLQKTARQEFENIANKLLKDKSKTFTETNKTNIDTLLKPLKEDINSFKKKVEDVYNKESKERFSLGEKVKELIEQTDKVSAEANNLTAALRGKPQKRGTWGEMILERILESSGLTKDREYFVQQSMKNEDGKNIRPDIIVKLPDERTIIIDSKVSLIAYDNFIATEDVKEQKTFLKAHIDSMYMHIKQLSEMRYDNLDTSLDFTMMFVPIEPAYLLAMQGDSDLWANAYDKRILLISPTNLIACLKLISDLWRREWQNKNAQKIATTGEALYNKFVGFTQTFEEIGKSLKTSQDKYDIAIGQLRDGRGNLVNQANKLRNLGLKSEKRISINLLSESFDDFEEVENEDEKKPSKNK